MTVLELTPIEETREAPPPMVHRCCCRDHSKLLCGMPRKGDSSEVVDVIDHTDCIVCDDLWDTTYMCPDGVTVCTNYQRCRGLA